MKDSTFLILVLLAAGLFVALVIMNAAVSGSTLHVPS